MKWRNPITAGELGRMLYLATAFTILLFWSVDEFLLASPAVVLWRICAAFFIHCAIYLMFLVFGRWWRHRRS